MKITLYKNTAAPNVVDKTSNLTKLWEGTGTLREACSILEPAMLVEADLSPHLKSANYMHIDDFGRYYYLNPIVCTNNNLFAISGNVDVLMSWMTEIKENSGVIDRQEFKYNLLLDDERYKVYSNPVMQRLEYSKGFDTANFVLIVAGGLG